jgi:arsenite transporter
MGRFERCLSLRVAPAIVLRVGLGLLMPQLFAAIAELQFAPVDLVVALLIGVTIWPMMIQVDFAWMREVGLRPRGWLLGLVVNWLIKPFTMAGLGVPYFRAIFEPGPTRSRPARASPA